MLRKKLLPLIFIIICSRLAYSQMPLHKAYIITYGNDTINGYGDMNASQDYCVFKELSSDKRKKYFPQDIAAFRFEGGDYFVARQIPFNSNKSEFKFLELLVDGEVDLYALGSSGRFYLEMEGEEFLELQDNQYVTQEIDGRDYNVKDNRYIGYIRYYLKDAPELYPKIDKMDVLNQKDLVKIAVEYHNIVCDEYDCVDYTKKVSRNIPANE